MSAQPPSPDVAGAMRIQLARRHTELAAGATALGWKVGFNTPAIQGHFGLHTPVVGYLTDATALEPGQPVAIDGWHQPMLEVELAIRIGNGGSISAIAPALELVDIDLPFDRIEPILEGNIFHRGVLFGTDVADADVHDLKVVVTREGNEVASGALTEDPAASVEMVRSFLGSHGADLSPGDRIIAGSLTPPLPVAPGDHVDVSYGSFGSFSVDFS
jgi:2-keto-4-pentenoate hydratase